MPASRPPPDPAHGGPLGEPLTLRVLVSRFRSSRNRGLAARNLTRHGLRALLGRARRITRPLRHLAHEAIVQSRIAVCYPLGFLRSTHQLVTRLDSAERPLGERVALFVHFDGGGRVLPATRDFLAGLAASGLSVVFVTNSGHLEAADVAFLRQHCTVILIRRNIGYDFGAWRDALDTLGLPRTDTRAIYLVNDSVYGPFADLQPLLGAVDFARADIWGATESWQHRYHLQSFFLVCGEAAIRSTAWRTFWRSVRPVPSKDWIIRHCEIGFTAAMSEGGVRCAAIFPSAALLDAGEIARLERVVADDRRQRGEDARLRAEAIHARHILRHVRRDRNALNPSVDLWRQLLRAGYPFLKRELLLRNPTRVPDVFAWEQVVAEALRADPEPLAENLRRSLGPRLPEVWGPRTAGMAQGDAAQEKA